MHRGQTRCDLPRNLQGELHLKPPRALDEAVERFSLDKLHRVEIVAPLPPKVEDGGNIGMTHTRRRARLPQKSCPRGLLTKIFFVNNFESHRATQVDVNRFVGDAHRTSAQLKWPAILTERYFVMLEALHSVARSAHIRLFGTSYRFVQSPAQQANGTRIIFLSGREIPSADNTSPYLSRR